jgi:Protein of unknown function (DUF3829)
MFSTARVWFFVLACVAIASAGCCKKKTPDVGDIPSAIASNDPGLEDPGESHRDSKIDRTIKCFNAAMPINKSANYYFKPLRGGAPRAGRTPSILFKPKPETNALCEEAEKDLTPPMAEIDRIMPRYVELVANLSKQLDDMDQYYKAKGYETDKYKKGKALHEVFKKDQEEFQKLHEELAAAIDAVTDKRDDESIEKEAKTRRLRYFSLVFLRDAKFLSREITQDKPDKAKFAELKSKIEASYDAFAEHAGSHPDQVSRAFMFGMYKSRADAFIESVRDADATKLRDRDLSNMLNKYNSMIDASNVVRWRSGSSYPGVTPP